MLVLPSMTGAANCRSRRTESVRKPLPLQTQNSHTREKRSLHHGGVCVCLILFHVPCVPSPTRRNPVENSIIPAYLMLRMHTSCPKPINPPYQYRIGKLKCNSPVNGCNVQRWGCVGKYASKGYTEKVLNVSRAKGRRHINLWKSGPQFNLYQFSHDKLSFANKLINQPS